MLTKEYELIYSAYGHSFISLESALSYHGWIPEAVYVTTCVSKWREREFKTSVGSYSYKRVPEDHFFTGVDRIESEDGDFFMATPWRAIADMIYTRHNSWRKFLEPELDLKPWKNLEDLELALRIDRQDLIDSDKKMLGLLVESYPVPRVCKNLKIFLEEISLDMCI